MKNINSTNKGQEVLESEPQVSICDVMKNNTSKIIRKMESQIPSYVQEYSNLYTESLHSLEDIFGTCYISEKQFFDKLGFDQNALKAFDNYWSFWTELSSSQIEISTNIMRSIIQMRISAIKSFDKYMHVMMETYAKMFSQFNTPSKK